MAAQSRRYAADLRTILVLIRAFAIPSAAVKWLKTKDALPKAASKDARGGLRKPGS